ncbi:MAG: alanine:cation symporter family protein, partial [Candidatus Limivicinus sp.]
MGDNLAWDIADTLNGMMMIPNLIGVLVLSPIVMKITKNYVDRKIKGKDVEPMLSAFPDIQKAHAAEIKAAESLEEAE